MFDKYPKPRRNQIIASKGDMIVRRFLQWITTVIAIYVILPVILLSTKDFFAALVTWISILLFFYLFLRPVYRFIHDKIFNYEERYRVQIIERLLYHYTYVAKIGWKEAKEYVDHLEKKYPTAVALEKWLDSK